MIRILSRYIYRVVIRATVLVVLALLGIELLIKFIQEINDIGRGHYGLVQVFLYILARLPSDVYQLFPPAAFLGSLIGLGQLAESGQLLAMRTAGISIARITGDAVVAAMMMACVVTVFGEWLAPQWLEYGQHVKESAMFGDTHHVLSDVWVKSPYAFLYIGVVNSDHEISRVNRFVVDKQYHLLSASYAPKGRYVNNQWVLYDVERSVFTPQQVKKLHIKTLPLTVVFDPYFLKISRKQIQEQSLVQLYQVIQYHKKAGLQVAYYQFSAWTRLLQPLTIIVMVCLGVPFVFGALRTSNIGSRIMTGIFFGFAFYMLNQFFGPLAMLYQVRPFYAAILPLVIFLLIYVIMMISLNGGMCVKRFKSSNS